MDKTQPQEINFCQNRYNNNNYYYEKKGSLSWNFTKPEIKIPTI